MSKSGQHALEELESRGLESVYELNDVLAHEAEQYANSEERMVEERNWELSKYATNELQAELERRGWINGVLMHPELDPSLTGEVE